MHGLLIEQFRIHFVFTIVKASHELKTKALNLITCFLRRLYKDRIRYKLDHMHGMDKQVHRPHIMITIHNSQGKRNLENQQIE